MHHVNLSVPEGGADAEAAFLVDLLGYRPAMPGPDAAKFGTLWWFDADDGTQVHLSVDPEHRPSARAHTAIWLDDELDPALDRLAAAGYRPSTSLEFDGDRHVFVTDPAGNLWELVGPPSHAEPDRPRSSERVSGPGNGS
jgi:catechol 2,3-dioxygenase-like lactoylglutathione lyase family enzyme